MFYNPSNRSKVVTVLTPAIDTIITLEGPAEVTAGVPTLYGGTLKDTSGNPLVGFPIVFRVEGPTGPIATYDLITTTGGVYEILVTFPTDGLYTLLVDFLGGDY